MTDRPFKRHSLLVLLAVLGLVSTAGDALSIFASPGRCGTGCLSGRGTGALTAWRDQLLYVAIFYAGAFGLGRLVQTYHWSVGDTRKILALTINAMPLLTAYWWGMAYTAGAITIAAAVFMLCLLPLTAPFRSRSTILATCFAAIDRPEDRPHTLTWLATSLAATWLVMIAWIWLLPYAPVYLFIALFICCVGDTLAEPIGQRYGRHTFTVRALWTEKTYTRSLEGSACVLLSGFVGVWLAFGLGDVSNLDYSHRYWTAMALFPAWGAIAEAKSPHTWDQPCIVATCGLITWAIGGGQQ